MKIKIWVVWQLALGLIVIFSCSSNKSVSNNPGSDKLAFTFYYDALSSLESGNFETALSQLDSAISLRPEFAKFYYVKGRVFEINNQADSALRAYEKSLNFKSHAPDVWVRLSDLYMKNDQYGKAIPILSGLIKNQPDSLSYLLELAEAYLRNDQPELALEQLNSYSIRGGNSKEECRLRGLAYYEQQDFEGSIKQLENLSCSKKSEDFEITKVLGISYIKIGSLEKGISYLTEALNLNRHDPEIFLYRARYFMKREKWSEAEDQLGYALKLDSTDYQTLLVNGKYYLSAGDTLKAEHFFQEAMTYSENCLECLKYLGIISDEKNKPKQALEYLTRYNQQTFAKDPEVEQRLDRLRKNNR